MSCNDKKHFLSITNKWFPESVHFPRLVFSLQQQLVHLRVQKAFSQTEKDIFTFRVTSLYLTVWSRPEAFGYSCVMF